MPAYDREWIAHDRPNNWFVQTPSNEDMSGKFLQTGPGWRAHFRFRRRTNRFAAAASPGSFVSPSEFSGQPGIRTYSRTYSNLDFTPVLSRMDLTHTQLCLALGISWHAFARRRGRWTSPASAFQSQSGSSVGSPGHSALSPHWHQPWGWLKSSVLHISMKK